MRCIFLHQLKVAHTFRSVKYDFAMKQISIYCWSRKATQKGIFTAANANRASAATAFNCAARRRYVRLLISWLCVIHHLTFVHNAMWAPEWTIKFAWLFAFNMLLHDERLVTFKSKFNLRHSDLYGIGKVIPSANHCDFIICLRKTLY